MRVVDTMGLKCPEPLIMTKRALKEISDGEMLRIITDNETSLGNLKRFLTDNSTSFTVASNHGVHTLTVERGSGSLLPTPATDYCEVPISAKSISDNEYAVVFSSEKMGEGNEDLGMILTKSFFITLLDSDNRPRDILFYNSGVKLAVKNSFVIEELTKLESLGVRLLLCGTCVNFYNLKKEIKIGIISNMYEMSEAMISVPKVIHP